MFDLYFGVNEGKEGAKCKVTFCEELNSFDIQGVTKGSRQHYIIWFMWLYIQIWRPVTVKDKQIVRKRR